MSVLPGGRTPVSSTFIHIFAAHVPPSGRSPTPCTLSPAACWRGWVAASTPPLSRRHRLFDFHVVPLLLSRPHGVKNERKKVVIFEVQHRAGLAVRERGESGKFLPRLRDRKGAWLEEGYVWRGRKVWWFSVTKHHGCLSPAVCICNVHLLWPSSLTLALDQITTYQHSDLQMSRDSLSLLLLPSPSTLGYQ